MTLLISFIRKLLPLTVDTRSDDLQVFVVALAFWSSHARLSVNRHWCYESRGDDLQVFVVAQAFWSSHARLLKSRKDYSLLQFCIIFHNQLTQIHRR